MWLVLSDKSGSDDLYREVLRFVYNCLDDWDREDGKGLSDFVLTRMICEMLEEGDFLEYKRVLGYFRGN